LGDIARNVSRLAATLRATKSYLAVRIVPGAGYEPALRGPLDGLVPARRARKALLVPVSENEL